MNASEGKYLTFSLKDENYGIPIETVQQIIAMMPITSVPKTPEFMKGVINLRGKIIPIMDLRLKLGIDKKDYTERTCIVVMDIHIEDKHKQMGVVVDTVSEVIDIKAGEIEPFSAENNQLEGDFITGIAKLKNKVVMLLDVSKVLGKDEIKQIFRDKN